ncbi:MAG: hypothetical protein ACQEWH_08140 [Bacillota bacterium]
MKKVLEANQQRKEKFLGLYEDDLVQKEDLVQRLSTLNEEKERLEERLSPILNFKGGKAVPDNLFNGETGHAELQRCLSLTGEQRKRLMHLLIRQTNNNEDR